MGSLVFTDDVTSERSSGMKVYTSVLHEHIQLNAAKPIGQRFPVPMDNDLKHTAKAAQGIQVKETGCFSVTKSIAINQ